MKGFKQVDQTVFYTLGLKLEIQKTALSSNSGLKEALGWESCIVFHKTHKDVAQ